TQRLDEWHRGSLEQGLNGGCRAKRFAGAAPATDQLTCGFLSRPERFWCDGRQRRLHEKLRNKVSVQSLEHAQGVRTSRSRAGLAIKAAARRQVSMRRALPRV